MRSRSYDQGRWYSPPAFRIGATDGVKNSGPTFATIIKSGEWASGGYRVCLGLRAGEPVKITAMGIRFILLRYRRPWRAR